MHYIFDIIGHRLLPQPPHPIQWLIGSYIHGHH